MALGVNIVSEFNAAGINKAIKDFKKLDNAVDKSAFALTKMDSAVTAGVKSLAKIGAVASVAAGIIGKQLVDAASDLQESISKVNVVFGDSAQEVQNFAKTAAQSMGISRQEALEAAGTYGNLLQAFGITRKEAVKMSTTMVQLAGDLASFNNVPIEDALMAIRSGLSGESEPLKRFGVAINDVRLKEEALRMGLYKGKGTLDILAKTQAAYALILKDTALAQGDYARTSDGVANTQRTLQATFTDVKAELGNALIPVYQSILSLLNDKIIPVIRRFADILGKDGAGGAFKYLGEQGLIALGKMEGWTNVIYGIVAAIIALKAATTAFTIASGLATIAVTAFGVAWNATGIGLIASLIAVVIVAVIALAMRFKKLREIFVNVWNVILSTFQRIVNILLGIWEFFINRFISSVNLIIRAWNKIPFTKKVDELKQVNLQLDLTALKINKVKKNAEASAAAFRLAEGWGGGSGTAQASPSPITTGGGAGAGTQETALKKLQDRLKKYADLVKTTGQLQRDLTAAVKGTGDANTRLAEANAKVAAAQERLLKVTQGFGAGSKQAATAQERLDQAQRDQTRAGFELERARNAVTDAEKNLADAQRRRNPEAIREAEIALAEAVMTVQERQIALRDATDATAEAQRQLNGTISGFPQESEEYKTALSELTDAQKDARDAIDSVADAKQRELEITNRLIASNKELAKMKKGGITKKQARQVAQSMKSSGVTITTEMWQTLGITPFAKGGIVTSPVNALIGEAGPEAVIPLDRMDNMMKGGDTYITVEVTSADPNAVVDALRRYQRQNGALPLRVQG